jgi:hypothetical protein
MEFRGQTKGYVLLEGPARDKNYALLRRPDIGRKLVALLYFPDHCYAVCSRVSKTVANPHVIMSCTGERNTS